ncbi:MAG TPA: G1 family glutamic endopeptidase [Nocardioidaceae bacterium]|jgi:peptidase A4-like protein|nr:G1 family glutamic endopeptidase [Nocardioidaceae bacterium]
MRRALVAALLTTPLLALVAVSTPAPAEASHRPEPRQAPNHKVTRSTSTNWAGYAAAGRTFTSVSAAWTQPTATCTRQQTYASFWVGLDGYTSSSVEQTGTDADCSASGVPSYYAWYEMYPKFPVNLSPAAYPVAPGDHLSASVTFATRNSFTLRITDSTRGWSFTTHQKQRASRSSAEVIAEAPSSTGGVLPLTDFGTAGFTGASANGQSLATFKPDRIDMVSGGTTKATTGALSSAGAFAVTWQHS